MDLAAFKKSTTNALPPRHLTICQAALWWDVKGNWKKAHSLVDSLDDKTACWVHAYLHRKEGDIGNADYWYRRAGKSLPLLTMQQEWEFIVRALLTTD